MNEETSIEIPENHDEPAIIARINELHAKAESLAKSAKDKANEAVVYALECGKLLCRQKKFISYGDFGDWVHSKCNFSRETAYRYMRLSKALCDEKYDDKVVSHMTQLENISPKTLRQAYIATGILPDTPKPDKSDRITPLVVHVTHIDAIVLWYRKTTEHKAPKNWNYIEREALINDLTPLMEIYNELIELQENSD